MIGQVLRTHIHPVASVNCEGLAARIIPVPVIASESPAAQHVPKIPDLVDTRCSRPAVELCRRNRGPPLSQRRPLPRRLISRYHLLSSRIRRKYTPAAAVVPIPFPARLSSPSALNIGIAPRWSRASRRTSNSVMLNRHGRSCSKRWHSRDWSCSTILADTFGGRSFLRSDHLVENSPFACNAYHCGPTPNACLLLYPCPVGLDCSHRENQFLGNLRIRVSHG